MPPPNEFHHQVSDEIKKCRFEVQKSKNQIRGKLDFINSLYDELQIQQSVKKEIQHLEQHQRSDFAYSPHVTERKDVSVGTPFRVSSYSAEKGTQTPNPYQEEIKPFCFDGEAPTPYVDDDVVEQQPLEEEEDQNITSHFSSQCFNPSTIEIKSSGNYPSLSCKESPKIEKKNFVGKNRDLSDNKRRLSLNYDRALRTIDQTCQPLLVSLKNLSGKHNSSFQKSFAKRSSSTKFTPTKYPVGPAVLLTRKSQRTVTNNFKSFYQGKFFENVYVPSNFE